MKKIKLNFLHICDEIIVSVDGKISIIGMFDTINSKDFPSTHPKFFVISNISADPGSYNQTIEIVSPKGEVIAKVSGKIDIKKGRINNLIVGFAGVKFEEPDKYWVRVSVGNQVISNEKEHCFNLIKEK
jgi:hypothetical protein